MKNRAFWGVLLIVIGCAALCYSGIRYSRRKTVLQIGSLIATTNKTDTIPLPPIVGVIIVVGGIAVLAWGRPKRPL